ncbi:hypothetical protein TIFTF001_006568 [Ficus carica]|uniref:Uncharacterized protein n=1 Tax=Ficus carica TaxID=3494 RepID=A0AA88A0S9_FICCA|nr:hypothetical protein TIFTF001_006568 [Ficus carica]
MKRTASLEETGLLKPNCCRTSPVHDDHAPPPTISFMSCSFAQRPSSWYEFVSVNTLTILFSPSFLGLGNQRQAKGRHRNPAPRKRND